MRLVAAARSTADCSGFGTAGGGDLAFGAVPAEFEPWLRRAGAVCPEIDSPLLAAQLQQENNFRYGPTAPVSPSGAIGPAQFMPGTWAAWGKDYDGDGTADPNSIGDAVMSQAHFMCALHQDVAGIAGDPIELTLAATTPASGGRCCCIAVPRPTPKHRTTSPRSPQPRGLHQPELTGGSVHAEGIR